MTRTCNALRDRGFTLVELMITVAIIAILAAIAMPNYHQYMVRSHRASAKQFILQIASKQEQYVLDARQYATEITGSGAGKLNLTIPPEAGRYDYTLDACGTPCSTYVITATPKAGYTKQVADGWLKLDNLGTKTSQHANKWTE